MAFAALHDVVRDAPLGQLLRYFTNNRLFQYPEEHAGFELPRAWVHMLSNEELPETKHNGSATPSTVATLRPDQNTLSDTTAEKPDVESGYVSEDKTNYATPTMANDGTILVDWYSDHDPANPQNWSSLRRALIGLVICLYTFVVYLSSAIYSPSTEGVMERFGVSNLKATLGLAMYVLGYGVGPLLFSPLAEIPRIGRNPVYIITFALFFILSFPTAFVNSFAGLIVLRFLQGFFGSPCLATGGASLGDMYGMIHMPLAMIAWVGAMSCGRKFSSQLFNGWCLSPSQPPLVLSSVDSPWQQKIGDGPCMNQSGYQLRYLFYFLFLCQRRAPPTSYFAAPNVYATLPAARG